MWELGRLLLSAIPVGLLHVAWPMLAAGDWGLGQLHGRIAWKFLLGGSNDGQFSMAFV